MEFTESLKKNYQFRLIYSKGRSVANKYAVMYILKNGLDENRLGISVSKKVGNSVVRNRVKRLIKENYRLFEKELKCGVDIIVIARQPIACADYYDVKDSLSHLLSKSFLFRNDAK